MTCDMYVWVQSYIVLYQLVIFLFYILYTYFLASVTSPLPVTQCLMCRHGVRLYGRLMWKKSSFPLRQTGLTSGWMYVLWGPIILVTIRLNGKRIQGQTRHDLNPAVEAELSYCSEYTAGINRIVSDFFLSRVFVWKSIISAHFCQCGGAFSQTACSRLYH